MTIEMTIGEVTAQTGVSAKALRLYEARGLLNPARSMAGRRIYSEPDLMCLKHVLTLKSLGLTLKQIGAVMESGEIDANRILTLQLQRTVAEQERLKQLKSKIQAGLKILKDGKKLDVDRLCRLIQAHDLKSGEAHFQEILDQWFTDNEERQWRDTIRKHGMIGEKRSAFWEALYERAEKAVGSNLPFDSAETLALAKDWAAALKQIADNMDRDVWNKGTEMFRSLTEGTEPIDALEIDKKTHAFMFAAIDYAKRHGHIP